MSYRNYNTANGHLVDAAGNGDYTTIQAAITAASSGQTIFIRPKSDGSAYSENLTLKAGVYLTAFTGDARASGAGTPQVAITGKATFTAAGTVNISNIQLNTNSDFCLAVTGSADSIVNLTGCYINCSNNTGISFTSSSGNSRIELYDCKTTTASTFALYSSSSAGQIYGHFSNLLTATTTASNNSAGSCAFEYCGIYIPLSTSSTGTVTIRNCVCDGSSQNTTILTTAGSGSSTIVNSFLNSGTASAVSVGTGTTVTMSETVVSSSNTNAITGAGSAILSNISYIGSSHQTNPTTQTGGAAFGLTQGTAPSAGCIGEQISSAVTTVPLASTTAKTITSINLTPGVWDISGLISWNASGATLIDITASISTTNNTVAGNLGDLNSRVAANAILANVFSLTVPQVRATLSTTTIYYLVANQSFGSGTCNGQGRITATRVG